MTDKEKRLKVTVDGAGAERDVGRIASAFDRLNSRIAAASHQLARFQSSLTSSMSRMAASVGGLTGSLRTGLVGAVGLAGQGLNRLGGIGVAALSGISGAMAGLMSMTSRFINVFRTALRTIVIGGVAFAGYVAAVADAGIKTDRFINTLVVLTGSTDAARQELNGLFETANKLGVSFTAAAVPFTKFAAAAAGALSRSDIRSVFESFAQVGAALQLSQSEVTGVFLALQQIASKGVVSMEELRLQLAERVPGAMRLAAASMNMTMSEFEKAVADRTINAAEFLRNFSKLLSDVFGQAAELASTRLFAGVNRLTNAFYIFRQQIFASGFESGLTKLIEAADAFLRRSPDLAKLIGEFSEAVFTRFSNVINNISTDDVVNSFNGIIGAIEKLINVLSEVSFHIRRFFDDDMDTSVDSIESRINTINRGLKRRAEISDQIFGGSKDLDLVDSVAEFFARASGNDFVLSRVLDRTKMTREDVQALDSEFNQLSANMAEAFYSSLQEDARAMGLELNVDLSKTSMEQLQTLFEESGLELSTTRAGVTLPRISNSGRSLGLNTSNIPDSDTGLVTGNTRAVQALTDQMLESEIPEFMSRTSGENMLSNMDELLRVSHELEVIEESRALLLDTINRKTFELRDLRMQELDENGENVANQTRLQTELTSEMEKYQDIIEKINDLQSEQTDILEKRQRDFEQWLSNQTLVKLALNLGYAFSSAFEEALINVDNFRDALNSLAEDVVRLSTRLLVTQPLASFLSSFIGGLLPIPGPGGLPPNLVDPTAFPAGGALPAHTGASFTVPGSGGVDSKRVTMAVTPGERITVDPLYKQNRAEHVTVSPPETKIEIHNYSGQPVREETTSGPDGSRLTKLIIGAVAEDISRGGDIAQILRGRYGFSPVTSKR